MSVAVAGGLDGVDATGWVADIDAIHTALDALTARRCVPASAGDDDLRAMSSTLARAKARLDAVLMLLARELHERDAARVAGAISTGHLLAADFGGDRSEANALVRTAIALSNTPQVQQALAAGRIDRAQAGVITRAMNHLPVAVPATDRERAEASLIDAARLLSITDLGRAATRAADAFQTRTEADAHEEDQLQARERRARRETTWWMRDNRDGTHRGGFVLPDAEAEMLRTAVEALSAPRRYHLTDTLRAGTGPGASTRPAAGSTDGRGDTAGNSASQNRTVSRPGTGGTGATGAAAPNAAVGDAATGPGSDDGAVGADGVENDGGADDTSQGWHEWLPTDRRHRQGRAFAALCAHLPADALPNAGGISAVLTVNLDYDLLNQQLGPGTLPSGTRISARKTREIACAAGILPQVLSGKALPLDLGQMQRLFTATQRRALAHRDRGCAYPGCDRPPPWCEGHHWRDAWKPRRLGGPHGPTDIANGCLLCAYHHRLVHERNIQFRERDGHLQFLIPPVIGLKTAADYGGDLFTPDNPPGPLQWQRNYRWSARD